MEIDNPTLNRFILFARITGVLILISGAVYAVGQLRINHKVEDLIFIGLSLFESIFIMLNGYWILTYIISGEKSFSQLNLSENQNNGPRDYLELIRTFGNLKLILPLSAVWAGLSSILPLVRHYWNNFTLDLLFAIFLFIVNIVTAYFLIILIAYFIFSRRLWGLINVELWKRENIRAHFLFGLSSRVSLYGTIYVSISLIAWLTSPIIPLGKEIIFIAIISVLILVSSIIIPTLPYIKKISDSKRSALLDIDEKIQKEYLTLLDLLDKSGTEINFNRINALMEMRQKIEVIQPFPYKFKTISTTISIVLISSIPIFIQYIFSKLFK